LFILPIPQQSRKHIFYVSDAREKTSNNQSNLIAH
jgi:hypothetical protein